MTDKELKTLFDLAEKLYWEELNKSEMTSIPYAFIEIDGKFLAISLFSRYSKIVKKELKNII